MSSSFWDKKYLKLGYNSKFFLRFRIIKTSSENLNRFFFLLNIFTTNVHKVNNYQVYMSIRSICLNVYQ